MDDCIRALLQFVNRLLLLQVFLDPEATPVSQEEPGQVLMEPGVRTVCPDVLELKVSLEKYWVRLVGLPEWTASLGPLETRASLGTTEDLVQLVGLRTRPVSEDHCIDEIFKEKETFRFG